MAVKEAARVTGKGTGGVEGELWAPSQGIVIDAGPRAHVTPGRETRSRDAPVSPPVRAGTPHGRDIIPRDAQPAARAAQSPSYPNVRPVPMWIMATRRNTQPTDRGPDPRAWDPRIEMDRPADPPGCAPGTRVDPLRRGKPSVPDTGPNAGCSSAATGACGRAWPLDE